MKYAKGTFLLTPNKNHLRGLAPYTQLVYMWLADFSSIEGECFPSIKTLSEFCKISTRSVQYSLDELVAKGFIKKIDRRNKGKSNLYQLLQMNMGKFREYNENKHQSDGLPEIDAESGEMRRASAPKNVKNKYWELIKWAEKRRGAPFLKQSVTKQFKAFAIAKTNGIKPPDLLKRWDEMAEDKFYSERGFDWMDVVQSFNRKGK